MITYTATRRSHSIIMLPIVVLIALSGVCSCISDVPVLIWSQNRPLSHLPQVHLGSSVNTAEFAKNYLSPLTSGKENLVIFLQEKLGLQDFTQYADVYNPFSDGGAFKNIKAFMDEQFSVHLPGVSSPVDAVESMKSKFDGKIHEVQNPTEVNDLDLSPGEMNLIIVHLTPGSEAKSEEEALASNDGQIGDVVRRLNKRSIKFTAVYTAKSSVQTPKERAGIKRRLLETVEADNGTFSNMTCMYFYARSITAFVDKGGKNTTVHLNGTSNFDDTGSECNNQTAILKLTYTDGNMKFIMTFHISDSNSTEWKIESGMVEVDGNVSGVDFTGEANMNTEKMNVWAPKDYSYHCSRLGPVWNNTNDNTTTVNVSLTFEGFQLQPFNIRNHKFSDGWDCVPFFTEGIWMGLLSVLLLTIILLYGFSMLADIRTMDKFDDAKGKTITVNVSE